MSTRRHPILFHSIPPLKVIRLLVQCDPSFRKRKVRNASCEDFQYLEPIQALNADLDLFQIELAFLPSCTVWKRSLPLSPIIASLPLSTDDPQPTLVSPTPSIFTVLEHFDQSKLFNSPRWGLLFYCAPHWLGNKSKNFFISSTYLSCNLCIPIAQSTLTNSKLIKSSAFTSHRPGYRTFL